MKCSYKIARAILPICGLLSSLGSNAQVLVVEQTNFYGGSGFENFNRVVETADGGFLGLGLTNSADGHFAGSIHPINFAGNAFAAKFDSTGALLWTKTYGGSGYDVAHGATQTTDGGYAILCTTTSNDYDVTDRVDTNTAYQDAWLIRLDASGNLLWNRSFGSSTDDAATDVLQTSDGGFLILGTSTGSDSDVAFHYGDPFAADWFLVKVDSVGHRQWRRVLGGTGHEVYLAARVFNAPGGGYYLAGMSESHDHDIAEDNVWPGGATITSGPVFLKLDDTGAVEWCKRYGGTGEHAAYSVGYRPLDTTLWAVGMTKANNNYFTGNHPQANGMNSVDMYLVMTDGKGELKLSKLYGTGLEEQGFTMGWNNTGEYLVAGITAPTFPLSTGYYGGSDTRMFTTNQIGDSLSTKTLGGNDNDDPIGVFYRDGRWIIFGNTISAGFTEGATGTPATLGASLFVTTLWQWPLKVRQSGNIADKIPEIIVVPNPSSGGAVICYTPASWAGRSMRVLDAEGKTVHKTTVHMGGQTALPVSGWQPGAYLVTVEAKEGHYAVKLLLQ